MKELYNAEMAREYSMIYRFKDEIDEIADKINEAVRKGETSCEYYDVLSSFVGDMLKKLGYTVYDNDSSWTDSGFITYIKW